MILFVELEFNPRHNLDGRAACCCGWNRSSNDGEYKNESSLGLWWTVSFLMYYHIAFRWIPCRL
jgi:hypothetical protein